MKPPTDKRIKKLWPTKTLAEKQPELDFDRARAIRLLEDALLRDDLVEAVVYLHALGYVLSGTGRARLAAGDLHGFVELEGFACLTSLAQIVNRVVSSHAQGVTAHLIVTGHDVLAKLALSELARARASELDEAFDALVLEAGVRLGLVEAKVPRQALGLYAEPLDALADDGRLAALIPGLCDEHIRRSSLATSVVEWFNVDYDLVPIELALLDHLRRTLHGLAALPAVEHPLLATPYAAIPHTRSFELTRMDRHDLWEMFVDLARAQRPELDFTGA